MKPHGISSGIRWCEVMQIKGIDFKTCDSLNNWVDFFRSPPPSDCINGDCDWKHSRIYVYENEDIGSLHGMIILRKRHGEFDGMIIKQELKTFLDRRCIDVQYNEIGERQISFTAVERHCIVVDSHKTLVPCFYGDPSTEPQAKKLKAVSHYTEANKAIKILTNSTFIGKSLSRYNSEGAFVANENSRRLCFISCFSTNLEPEETMWEKFADEHKGCKLDFIFKRTLADAFPLKKAINCEDEQGQPYEISFEFNHVEGTLPHVFFTSHYSLAQYTADLSNKATLQVFDSGSVEDFTISPYVGRNVSSGFEYQSEVRILLQLNSFYREEIPFIQKVEIPFETTEIEQIVLTIGKNATSSARRRIEDSFGNSRLITIQSEIG